jgi:thiol-disulfide isomerase/thioredoxin
MKKMIVLATAALALACCGAKPQPDVEVGDAAPKFAVAALDGVQDTVLRSGKVTLLMFFATWCPHCVAEMPQVQALYNELKGNPRFALAAVAREQSAAEVKSFWAEKAYTMPAYADERREAYSLFARQGIPRFYLVDGSGTVSYLHVGSFETQGALDTLKMNLHALLQ